MHPKETVTDDGIVRPAGRSTTGGSSSSSPDASSRSSTAAIGAPIYPNPADDPSPDNGSIMPGGGGEEENGGDSGGTSQEGVDVNGDSAGQDSAFQSGSGSGSDLALESGFVPVARLRATLPTLPEPEQPGYPPGAYHVRRGCDPERRMSYQGAAGAGGEEEETTLEPPAEYQEAEVEIALSTTVDSDVEAASPRTTTSNQDQDPFQEVHRVTATMVDDQCIVDASIIGSDDFDDNDNVLTKEIMENKEKIERLKRRQKYGLYTIGALVIVGIISFISVYFTRQSGNDEPTNPLEPFEPAQMKLPLTPVLETLKKRGVLRCGVNPDSPSGFSLFNKDTNEREGFEIDLCKAVAAASLGSSYRFETIVVTPVNRFLTLASGEVDLLVAATTHTFDRDVQQASTGTGFSFSAPYLYGGLTFGGVPEFVACADKLSAVGDCAKLLVCVIPGTTWMDVTKALFPGSNIVSVEEQSNSIQGLIDGICNVIVGEQYEAPEVIVRSYGYEGPYALGKHSFSKEPLAIVTRDGDPEFAEFTNMVLGGLLYAEEQNVTMETADTFINTDSFGDEFENVIQNALTAVGNYGEIYSRHLEHIASRLKVNMLNNGNTGLLYSHPFGQVDTIGPGPIKGGVIEIILQRGFLRCGTTLGDGSEDLQAEIISGERAGLGIEFCCALSAIVFKGRTDNISFESFPKTSEYKNIALALKNGDIDVYLGGEVPLNGNARHSGLSFSKPYFYEAQKEYPTAGKAFSLITKEDDAQWSDLVYWVIMATFYAEENDIVQMTSNEMPLVSLFGPDLERILRDTILAVGNYGEMHQRVFGQNVTRVGRNLLNIPPFGPQHYPSPFGNHLTG